MTIEFSRWFWCERCNYPSIECESCGNSSCNGGGCERCLADFIEVAGLIAEGKAPAKDQIPLRPIPDWYTTQEERNRAHTEDQGHM